MIAKHIAMQSAEKSSAIRLVEYITSTKLERWDLDSGGPRLRVHNQQKPNHTPALNKIPFVKWGWYFHYLLSTHDAWPHYLNRAHTQGEVSSTGALFHFKMVSTLIDKTEEEMKRGEHYAGSQEYKRYFAKKADSFFFEPDLSVRYENPRQLSELGLMSLGQWY